jgi:hypothetical protein
MILNVSQLSYCQSNNILSQSFIGEWMASSMSYELVSVEFKGFDFFPDTGCLSRVNIGIVINYFTKLYEQS